MRLGPSRGLAAALAPLVLLAACDTGGFDPLGTSPSRPEISIAKAVGMVSAEELVGTWTCRELNPYPDQPSVTTTLTLNADGTVQSEALLPMAAEMPGATDMIMSITGEWQVEGDRLIITDSDVAMTAADGSTGGMSAMMNSIAASFVDRAGDSTAEIYKVSATELVMRGDEADAAAVACLRAG